MAERLIEGIAVLNHSAIRIENEKTIYFDPFGIKEARHDADIIFITHDHYDHFSPEDIAMVRKENTHIVIPVKMKEKLHTLDFPGETIHLVAPEKKYTIEGFTVETIPAYNEGKPFHPKSSDYIGYLLTMSGITYYVAGDTDVTKENKKVKCDVAMIPIGGTYTMNAKAAAELINTIKPKVAIPTHYGSLIGKIKDAEEFRSHLAADIECVCMLKF